MGDRPTTTCRLAFAVLADADVPGDDEGGVEWRDVSCYVTDDASLVVHRNGDDPSVYSLSHAPTGRLIPTEVAGSPDPLIELANRLSRMTDWAALETGKTGRKPLFPQGRRFINIEYRWNSGLLKRIAYTIMPYTTYRIHYYAVYDCNTSA